MELGVAIIQVVILVYVQPINIIVIYANQQLKTSSDS